MRVTDEKTFIKTIAEAETATPGKIRYTQRSIPGRHSVISVRRVDERRKIASKHELPDGSIKYFIA